MQLTAGQRIRQAREAAGWNQGEFAKMVGCARSTLSEIETGESKLPSAEVLQRMAEVLGRSPRWIMYGEDGDVLIPTEDEAECLALLRAITEEQRDAIRVTLRALASSQKS